MDYTISDAEWQVMRLIWSQPRLTSREIIDQLQQTTSWKEGTIKSLMNRLMQKKLIASIDKTRPYQYVTTIDQKKASLDQINGFIDRICQRQVGTYLNELIETSALSQDDCTLLIQTLEQKRALAPTEIPCNCPIGECHCTHTNIHT